MKRNPAEALFGVHPDRSIDEDLQDRGNEHEHDHTFPLQNTPTIALR